MEVSREFSFDLPFCLIFINIADTDPFDCASDPCHMAWLIRDNRDLLTPVASAQCSNGTWFTDLNPSALKGCPK